MKESTRRWSVFVVTALGAFVVSLDLSIVNVAFPAMEASFPSVSRSLLAWVITGYSVVFGSLLVVGGRTADRVGRRRVFFVGIAVFTVGSALCGLAPTVPLLIAGRLLQGAGAAFALPASLGLLLGVTPAGKRSQTVALWGGIGALAVATGPSLGALIITLGGWRWAFVINIPVGILTLAWGRTVLVEAREAGDRPTPDYLGVVLIAAALASLVLAISQGPTWGWDDPRVLAAFAVAAVAGPAFVYRSAHHPEPVLDLRLFASRSFRASNVGTVFYAMGFFAMLLGNILFLVGVWHYSILRAGLSVTPGPIVVAVVAGPAGRLAGRIGFRIPLVVGAAVFAGSLVWFALGVGPTPDYVGMWLPATLLLGLGIGLTFPVISAAAVSSLPPDRLAVGSAVNQTSRQVGGALGVAVLVAILGEPATEALALASFRHLWLFAAAMGALSGVVALFQPGRPGRAGSAVAGPSGRRVSGVEVASGVEAASAEISEVSALPAAAAPVSPSVDAPGHVPAGR